MVCLVLVMVETEGGIIIKLKQGLGIASLPLGLFLVLLIVKGAFPSTDHKQLVRVLEFLGLPSDFTRLVSNLHSGATTEFITPHGHTSPVGT